MPHGLDHIVHAVRDLDAAAEFYASAGFTVGARNRHPWGTHNRIVQLRNCYIEILEVAEPEKIVPHGAHSFSFGAFNRDFLASREGFSMLILNSSNAADDARSFEAAGIGGFKVFDFARDGTKPDGTPVKLAFSLAFARDPTLTGCALCGVPASFSGEFLESGVPDPRQRRANRARCGDGRRQSDRPPHLPEGVHRRERSAFEFDRHQGSHREWRCRNHGAGRVSRSVRHFARRQRRGDDAQRDALCGFGYRAGRDLASAERNCLAAPCRTAGACRRTSPMAQP